MAHFASAMLDPSWAAAVAESDLRKYADDHFCIKKKTLQLASQKALVGMLCRCPGKVDEVGLFCAVKSAEWESGGRPRVRLWPVFDQHK